MLGFTVFPKGLAVIPCDHDQRTSVIKPQPAQAGEKPAHLHIIERNFAVVEATGVAAVERLGRAIRAVRVVQVNPQKKGFAGM